MPKDLPALLLEMESLSNPEVAKSSSWFFKTGTGEYGEGDMFIGLRVPTQRKLSKKYIELGLVEIKKLLVSPIQPI